MPNISQNIFVFKKFCEHFKNDSFVLFPKNLNYFPTCRRGVLTKVVPEIFFTQSHDNPKKNEI